MSRGGRREQKGGAYVSHARSKRKRRVKAERAAWHHARAQRQLNEALRRARLEVAS